MSIYPHFTGKGKHTKGWRLSSELSSAFLTLIFC